MEYYNSKLSRFVEISPPRKIGFHQYIEKIDKSPGDRKWRILFNDEKSKELSDMGEQRDKLELRFKLKIDQEIPREFLENRFDLRIDRAKLCDGGYTRQRSCFLIQFFFSKFMTANFLLFNKNEPCKKRIGYS